MIVICPKRVKQCVCRIDQLTVLSLTVKKNMKYVEDLNIEFAKSLHGVKS